MTITEDNKTIEIKIEKPIINVNKDINKDRINRKKREITEYKNKILNNNIENSVEKQENNIDILEKRINEIDETFTNIISTILNKVDRINIVEKKIGGVFGKVDVIGNKICKIDGDNELNKIFSHTSIIIIYKLIEGYFETDEEKRAEIFNNVKLKLNALINFNKDHLPPYTSPLLK